MKEAGGEDSSWLGGCSLEEPRHAATGGGGVWCWGRGSREDRGREGMQEKRQEAQTSGEGLGAGREEAGPGPWASGPRPRHLLSFRVSPGCLALGAERS